MSFFNKNRGVITVFVTLIMVPIVVFTGTMVDLARLKLYSSLAVVAADSYGEAVLGEYDKALKDMYGLFSITQTESGRKALDEYSKQTSYMFNPNGDDGKMSGFMPYSNAEVKISYTPVDDATLNNPDVFISQINSFMKFRAVQKLLIDRNAIFEAIEEISNSATDMAAVSKYNNLSNELSDCLKNISTYYGLLKKIKQYPAYTAILSARVNDYNNALKNEFESDNYKQYYKYLNNKNAIDTAIDKRNKIEENKGNEKLELTDEEKSLCDDYFDAASYQRDTLGKLYKDCGIAVQERTIKDIEIEFSKISNNSDSLNSELYDNAIKIEDQLEKLKQNVDELKAEIDKCSEDLKQSMLDEIADIEELTVYKGQFIYIADNINRKDISYNTGNSTNMDSCEDKFNGSDGLYSQLFDAELNPDSSWSDVSTDFSWWDFYNDDIQAHNLYDSLEKICGATSGVDGDKKAADKKKDAATKKRDEAVKEMEDDSDEKGKRNISDEIAKELEVDNSAYTSSGILNSFGNSSLFKSLGNSAEYSLDKILLVTYDFGMFSSRVTDIKVEDDEKEENTSEEKTESEMSLTDYPLSSDYLYGAELEYLFAGKTKSSDNLKSVRNMICTIRMAFNYISTYTITELNNVIKQVSTAAADAVAATGAGAPFAPLVKVAVSGALRAGISAMETAADWKILKERKRVVLKKNKLSQLNCGISQIIDLLGENVPDSIENKDDKVLSLNYEEYVMVMLFIMVNNGNLAKRTGNLITLNVNWAQTDDEELSKLDFKLSDTVTAVKSTCSIKEKFVIAPKHFMQMFLQENNTQKELDNIEDEAYSYSVIRGY